jgi:cytochrome P450
MRYSFLEGGRMRATAGLFRDAAVDAEVQDGSETVKIPKGHRLLVNMVKASMDPTVFPDPTEVKLDRDIKSYIHYGWGPHQCAGLDASQTALSTMFKAVMKLDGLRRAPGPQGEVKKIPAPYGYTIYMLPDWSGFYPIPTTMKIQWDEPASKL